jgi:hypothetical protein
VFQITCLVPGEAGFRRTAVELDRLKRMRSNEYIFNPSSVLFSSKMPGSLGRMAGQRPARNRAHVTDERFFSCPHYILLSPSENRLAGGNVRREPLSSCSISSLNIVKPSSCSLLNDPVRLPLTVLSAKMSFSCLLLSLKERHSLGTLDNVSLLLTVRSNFWA